MKKINISTIKYPNTFAIVDDGDFDYLNQYKWCLNSHRYVVSRISNKLVKMHSLLVVRPKGKEIDHINRDKLDNRRENLRTVSHRQNTTNVGLRANNTSGHKGICWDKHKGMWMIRVFNYGEHIFLGYSHTLQKAIKIRKMGERKYGYV